MNVMTIREFTRNIYAYIKKPGKYVLTINGSKKIDVEVKEHKDERIRL